MRELTPMEREIAGGGQTEEFRSIVRHEIPRFEEVPSGYTHELERQAPVSDDRAPLPIPLHWLPPREENPEVF